MKCRLLIYPFLLILGPVFAAQGWAQQISLPKRDLRFAMSDLYYTDLPPAAAEVDLSAAMGVDELWISYIHETGGNARLVDQLRRARVAGHKLGQADRFRVVFGLGASTSKYGNVENLYIDPYVDASLTYSPRSAPRGDFFGSATGQDHDGEDIRTALVGRDAPGLLVNDAYWMGGVSVSHEPRSAPAPRIYRFRFPILLGANMSAVEPSQRIATLRIVAEPHVPPPPTLPRITYAERDIVVADLVSANQWQAFDVFVNNATDDRQIDVEVEWTGLADMSLGRMQRDHWDPSSNQPMVAAIEAGIIRSEPRAKYGRNVFDFLDDLHAEIESSNPRLFENLAGFWMIDEPSCFGNVAWRMIAEQLESYFRTKPGYVTARTYTNFQGGDDTNPNNRFHKLQPVEECMKFGAPIYSFDQYMLLGYLGPRSGPQYQGHIEYLLEQWRPKVNACRAHSVPCQNFITLWGITVAEIPLQVYLSLALGFDRTIFWEISQAANWSSSPPALTEIGAGVRSVTAEARRMKPIYDRLDYVGTYNSQQLAGRYVLSIQDTTGLYQPSDLWIEIGEFMNGSNKYLLLVNRHTGPSDQLTLTVRLDVPHGPNWNVVDAATGEFLGRVSASSSFSVELAPGGARLIGVLSPDFGDLNHDACIDRADFSLLSTELGSPNPPSSFDIDQDGSVDITDAKRLVQLFSRPHGHRCN